MLLRGPRNRSLLDIIQRQVTQKRYKIALYLQWRANRKSYVIYRTVPFSMTLNSS